MSASKISTREALIPRIAALQAGGAKVGYTSGVFDLLHPGHVDYIEKARQQCDHLIVGVNSDASVKTYKDAIRPICGEDARAMVMAGLGAVDSVFIFGERNNNQTIELLKPDIYFKAGDYSKDSLSSAPIVEKYGGTVIIIPMLKGYSSSDIIDRIAHLSHPAFAVPEKVTPAVPAPAVFLDRDGTINTQREYLHIPSEFELIPGALEGMKRLQEAGYLIIIVTNQPGIGLGYFQKEDLYRVNAELLKAATKIGLSIDKLYYCPHNKAENCSCRKPAPGMISRAVKELSIDLARSYVIGDMTSDLMLGKNAGCGSILVRTGKGGTDTLYTVTPDHVAEDVGAAAEWILSRGA